MEGTEKIFCSNPSMDAMGMAAMMFQSTLPHGERLNARTRVRRGLEVKVEEITDKHVSKPSKKV